MTFYLQAMLEKFQTRYIEIVPIKNFSIPRYKKIFKMYLYKIFDSLRYKINHFQLKKARKNRTSSFLLVFLYLFIEKIYIDTIGLYLKHQKFRIDTKGDSASNPLLPRRFCSQISLCKRFIYEKYFENVLIYGFSTYTKRFHLLKVF